MIGEVLGVVASVVVAAAILLLVPRRNSYAWAIGLLIFAILGNLSSAIEGVVSYYNPATLYLDTKENQLEFNQGQAGEVFGVRVKNPPPSYRTSRNNLPWTLPLSNLLLVTMILVFVRRAASESSKPGSVQDKPAGAETGQNPGK